MTSDYAGVFHKEQSQKNLTKIDQNTDREPQESRRVLNSNKLVLHFFQRHTDSNTKKIINAISEFDFICLD